MNTFKSAGACAPFRLHAVRRPLAAALLASTALMAAPVAAQEWTGTSGNNWFNTGNWSTGVLPDATTDIVINNTPASVRIGAANARARDLLLSNNKMEIQANSNLTIRAADVAAADGSVALIEVNGANSVLTSTGLVRVGAGAGSNGSIGIGNGGFWNAHSFELGSETGSLGIIDIGTSGNLFFGNASVIGRAGSGILNIQDGGLLEGTGPLYLGQLAGGSGELRIDNGNADVRTIFLGMDTASQGSIYVQNGGILQSWSMFVGAGEGGQGLLQVDMSEMRSIGLVVGQAGVGEASFRDAQVSLTGGAFTVGQLETGVGTLVLSDFTDFDASTLDLRVGEAGQGFLDVLSSSTLEARSLSVGRDASGRGLAVVDNAELLLGRGFIIGDLGRGSMVVRGGGLLVAGESSVVGLQAGSIGELTITDDKSTVEVQGELQIGGEGQGRVTVLDGAVLNTERAGFALLNGDGALLLRNATWLNALGINLGAEGNGYVEIDGRNGQTRLVTQELYLGDSLEGVGRIDISGADALLLVDNGMYVGAGGNGAIFAESGAWISASQAVLGQSETGHGSVSLTGANWDTDGQLTVGDAGYGEITADDGSIVTADTIVFGAQATGVGEGTITDSILASDGEMIIGQAGQGRVSVVNGALAANGGLTLGEAAGSSGRLTVDGPDSELYAGFHTDIGRRGFGELILTGGAEAEMNTVQIGGNAGGEGILDMAGAGTVAEVAELVVATAGRGTVNVSDDARLATGALSIGNATGGKGEVNVDGGVLEVGVNGVYLGSYGGTGDLTVTNGGRASVTGMTNVVGSSTDGVGRVTVAGAGSELIFGPGSTLTLGRAGLGTMTVTDDGFARVRDLMIGEQSGSQGTLTVNTGGRAEAGSMTIGERGGGTLRVTDDGAFSAGATRVGVQTPAAGIIDVGTFGRADFGTLELGVEGQGLMNVYFGGSVEATTLTLGVESGGRGRANITGEGELTVNGDLVLGQSGEASLQIQTGGVVNVAGDILVARNANSSGLISIGSLVGELPISAGILNAATIRFGDGLGEIRFNHDDLNYDFAAVLEGSSGAGGAILYHENGDTRLTGAAGLSAIDLTNIVGGRLRVDGGLNSVATLVGANGALGGSGTITGDVEVAGSLFGRQGQTLTINGNLYLANGSRIDAAFGPAGGARLFSVSGDLMVDQSTINITDIGGFGPGIYGLIGYGGSLTAPSSDAFVFGTLPGSVSASDLAIQYAPGEVNIVSTAQQALTFWDGGDSALWDDGVVNGGSGTWSQGVSSFTDYSGATNGEFQPMPAFAIFQGAAGTVTVDNTAGPLSVTGMQFARDGYVLTGGALELTRDESIIRVGDGTNASDAMTARIETALTGTGGLVKSDGGVLELTGANSYAGNTILRGGVLAINGDGALGAASGDLFAEGGDLRLLGDWDSSRSLYLASTLGLDTNGFDSVLSSEISGVGGLVKRGSGRLTLDHGNLGWTGDVDVQGGELNVTGAIGGDVTVFSGAGLFGAGTIGGDTSILSGGSLNGTQGQTLSFLGDLSLSSGSRVNVALDAPGNQALFDVGGNLTLDGVLNVSSAGEFGAGVYRLFDYGGALTNNGLDIGTTPAGIAPTDLAVQTSVTGQVNLLNSNDATLLFWDGDAAGNANNGLIDGGNGVWSLASGNWTDADGLLNGAINPVPGFAVFMGQGGTVTVDGSAGALSVTGMQFAADGYRLQGDSIALTEAQSVIRVGDGTSAGASMTATIDSVLTGSGRLVKSDLGTLVLTGGNSYTGGTYVQAGTLVGSTGSIRGDIVNEGVVRFNQTVPSSDLNGTTSGSGQYIKSGSGSLRLVGASTSNWTLEQGHTTVLSGFTGNAAISNSAVLTFDQTNGARTWGGVLSGAGAVEVNGPNMATFTGQSQGFTGYTTVNGWLSLDGRLGGTLDVMQGGRLQGSGRVGNLNVAGTVNPGNSIGTLQVDGNLTFLAGSTYEVEVNPQGQSDRISVLGTANLFGGSVLALGSGGNYAPQTAYTILTAAGGVNGQFGSVASDLAFLDAALNYTTSSVVLTLTRNDIDFAAVAWTPNQHAAATAVEDLGMGDDVWDAVVTLSAEDARYAFDQLSGDAFGSMGAAQVEDGRMVREAFVDRLNEDAGRGAWIKAYGLTADHDSDFNAGRFERDLTGVVMGADTTLLNGWRVGLGGGYAVGDYSGDTRGFAADGETWSLGGYAGRTRGSMTLNTGLAWSWTSADTARAVIFPGFAELNEATVDSRLGQAFAEASWTLPYDDAVTVEPYVGAAFIHWSQDGFAEIGGASALTGDDATADLGLIRIGARAAGDWRANGWDVRLSARAGLRQMVGDTDVTPVMTIGGQTMDGVRGLSVPGLAAELELGAEVQVREGLFLSVSAQALASGRNTDTGAALKASWRF